MKTETTDNPQQPVHAGCVAGPDMASAGCVVPTGDESRPDALQSADGRSAGCATPAATAESEPRLNPPTTLREFEAALRRLGFTRSKAADIARRGFVGATKHTDGPSEDRQDIQRLSAAVNELQRLLKGP